MSSTATVAAALVLAIGSGAAAAMPGTELWVARYDSPAPGFTSLDHLAVAPDGSKVFAAGDRVTTLDDGRSRSEVVTVAYDSATGQELWDRRFAGPFGDASPLDLALAPDGSAVFVTGRVSGGDPVSDPAVVQDYLTIAYDAATGTRLWLRTYDGFGDNDIAFSVAASGDAVFVTGQSYTSPFVDSDYATLAYDAGTGQTIWLRRFDSETGTGASDDYGAALGITNDGSTLFVTGTTFSSEFGLGDIKTMAYDAGTGHLEWSRRFEDLEHAGDLANELIVAAGTVFITGQAGGSSVTLAYTVDGHRLWIRPQRASISDMAATPQGSAVFVTGTNTGAGTHRDFMTRAYDGSTGSLLWKDRYNGPTDGNDGATGIATSSDGAQVFVTGAVVDATTPGTDTDVVTIAYDGATGDRGWVRTLERPHGRAAAAGAVAADPLGRAIYITGRTTDAGFSTDSLTVAYAA